MKLTICLISKGRPDYLPFLLASFNELLDLEEVDFLFIDNGSDSASCKLLSEWALANSNKVVYIRYEYNDPRPSRYWSDIYAKNLDWVLMPGDDDILIREGVLSFLNIAKTDIKVNVIGGSAQIIDQDGFINGNAIKPVTSNSLSHLENLAGGFHGPGFIWPATFFKPKIVGANVPSSRFAFDWYLDCIFILNMDYLILEEKVLKYRIHDFQETNMASLRRKYFEGFFWLSILLDSKLFTSWLSNLPENDVSDFWMQLMRNRPVYGDEEFGRQFAFKVAEKISSLDISHELLAKVSLDLASLNNVFLGHGEIKHFLKGADDSASVNQLANIKFIPAFGLCISSDFFEIEKGSGEQIVRSIEVHCGHTAIISDFQIECNKYTNVQKNELQEMLLIDLEFYLQKIGFFEPKLTSLDRKILNLYPKIIDKLPKFVTKLIKFTLNLRK
jgi:hypothetical protein